MEALKKTISTLKNTLFKDKYFIYLSILFFVFLALYWGRFGNPVIDCGREAYIPFAMADLGKVLFKDIVCIYGPVPYYLNALFVKLFGAHLDTMYSIGALLSYIFLFGIYNLAKRFLNVRLAFLYACIIIFCCILNPSISNYIFPYSYAIVYALVFAVFHLIFLFKFIDGKKAKNLYISAFLLSFCLLSKFDFIPCILPFLIALLKYRKNLNLKTIIRILTSFFTPFLIIALILICQKVSLQNLFFNFKMISNMAHSPSLQYFYTVCTGYFFDFKKTFMFVKEFCISSLILLLAGILTNYTFNKIKKLFPKTLTLTICLIGAIIIMFLDITRYIFLYIPLIVFIFFIFKIMLLLIEKFKKHTFTLSNYSFIILLFILFSILFSLKTLFGLFHELYGTYYLPFILLSFFIIITPLFVKYKVITVRSLMFICYSVSFVFCIQGAILFNSVKNYPVKTLSGTITTDISIARSILPVLDFIQTEIKNESVLVLPEGLFFNFALKKDYKFFNTTFTPMDFDAYGEIFLIEQLLNYNPRYIIFLPRDYSDYGKTFICTDFGLNFCNKISDLYKFKTYLNIEKITPETPLIAVFERKNND